MTVGDSATPLAKVRGLGSAQHGGEHWLRDKVQSAALVLLGAWLLTSLLLLPTLDQRTLTEWLRSPLGAVPMALFVVTGFRHGLEGMKVVVDDYVDHEGNRFAVNTLLLFLAYGGAGLALFALGRIAFGGGA
ncbi:MAG TPA: succinate dehydrogenase, hydrophobic membrane anchor protein [Sphingomicrobium sp.]|jgi:succinate dehydrogenase / fumarate reductase, membrane anchor subunit|nr:succinate dehydrogenase, hydrophobic membrane anchor protein [Sphingomicrobium sp.]